MQHDSTDQYHCGVSRQRYMCLQTEIQQGMTAVKKTSLVTFFHLCFIFDIELVWRVLYAIPVRASERLRLGLPAGGNAAVAGSCYLVLRFPFCPAFLPFFLPSFLPFFLPSFRGP